MTGRRIIHDAPGNQVRPMTALDRTVLLLAVLWAVAMLFVLAAVAFSSTVTTQVSHGLPASTIYLPSLPQATGARVVYVQDATTLGAHELWSVGMFAGAPIRLSNALASGQSVKFQIAPDGQRVVYQTDQTTRGIPDLYSAPIAGGASVKLSMDLASLPGQVRDFLVSPDSQRAYYAADGAVNNLIELWRVDLTGGPSTRLNAAISGNYDVFEYAVAPQDRLVYRVGRATVGGHELWSVPGDGRASQARRISRDLVAGGGVRSRFMLTPDGQRVVYSADALDNGRFDLWSAPVIGGTSTRLAEMAGVRIKLAQELTSCEVERDIECEWRFNVFDGTAILVRTDTGEAVELRDITAEERQMQLGEAVKAPTPEQLSQWKKQLAKRGVTIEPQERPLL